MPQLTTGRSSGIDYLNADSIRCIAYAARVGAVGAVGGVPLDSPDGFPHATLNNASSSAIADFIIALDSLPPLSLPPLSRGK